MIIYKLNVQYFNNIPYLIYFTFKICFSKNNNLTSQIRPGMDQGGGSVKLGILI